MRNTAFAVSALLAGTLLSAQQASQETMKQDSAERDSFATKWQLSKGGIGMVNKNLYIVVKSTKNDRNEVIVTPTEETEERWKGKSVTKAELAIIYEGKVWSSKAIPDGFDLSKAVVVSFERRKIRFFHFQMMAGGYYDRIAESTPGIRGKRSADLNTINWCIFWRIAALPTLFSARFSYNLESEEHAPKRERTKTSVGFERKTIISGGVKYRPG